MGMDEATRQLRFAVHDVQVAFDCIGLGEIDQAHTHAITAKAAIDAAETALRQVMADLSPEEAARAGVQAVKAIEEQESKR